MKTPQDWVNSLLVNFGNDAPLHLLPKEPLARVVAEAQAEAREDERRRLLELAAADCPEAELLDHVREMVNLPFRDAQRAVREVDVFRLVFLAEWLRARVAFMARDNGYRDGWDARVTYGPWTTLGELREGALFESRDGIRAVKSEYHYGNGAGSQCQCVLLESGEYAHFPGRNNEPVREIVVKGVTP